jgi:hypothetical protein
MPKLPLDVRDTLIGIRLVRAPVRLLGGYIRPRLYSFRALAAIGRSPRIAQISPGGNADSGNFGIAL